MGHPRAGHTKLHLRRDARACPASSHAGRGARDQRLRGIGRDLAPGARCLLGDMGYDADRVREELLRAAPAVIREPGRRSGPLDRALYRLRNESADGNGLKRYENGDALRPDRRGLLASCSGGLALCSVVHTDIAWTRLGADPAVMHTFTLDHPWEPVIRGVNSVKPSMGRALRRPAVLARGALVRSMRVGHEDRP